MPRLDVAGRAGGLAVNLRRRNKGFDSPEPERRSCGPEGMAASGAAGELDAAHRMALEGLAQAFEEAEAGRDWFAMKTALLRVDDAVQAVWYASRVRDDGRR